jgi:hypothetical protein
MSLQRLILTAAVLLIAAGQARGQADVNVPPDPVEALLEMDFDTTGGAPARDPLVFKSVEELEQQAAKTTYRPPKIEKTIPDEQEGSGEQEDTEPQTSEIDRRLAERRRQFEAEMRQALAHLRGMYVDATAAMKFDQVLRFSGEAVERIEQQSLELGPLPDIEEQILRIRRAAERLDRRAAAERAFEALPLTISGIVWREAAPLAVINGQVCTEGATVTMPSAAEKDGPAPAVRVYRIDASAIVFIYDGYKFQRKLRDSSS